MMMRDEYDIEYLNPRENPYAKKLKKLSTNNTGNETTGIRRGFKRRAAGV